MKAITRTGEKPTQRGAGTAPAHVTISSGSRWTTGVFKVQTDDTGTASDPATAPELDEGELRQAMDELHRSSTPEMREQVRRVFLGMRRGSSYAEARDGLVTMKEVMAECDLGHSDIARQVLVFRGMSAYRGKDPQLLAMQAEILSAGDVVKNPAYVRLAEDLAEGIFGAGATPA